MKANGQGVERIIEIQSCFVRDVMIGGVFPSVSKLSHCYHVSIILEGNTLSLTMYLSQCSRMALRKCGGIPTIIPLAAT